MIHDSGSLFWATLYTLGYMCFVFINNVKIIFFFFGTLNLTVHSNGQGSWSQNYISYSRSTTTEINVYRFKTKTCLQ